VQGGDSSVPDGARTNLKRKSGGSLAGAVLCLAALGLIGASLLLLVRASVALGDAGYPSLPPGVEFPEPPADGGISQGSPNPGLAYAESRESLEQLADELADEEARRDTPAAEAEREDSQTAYSDLGDRAAIDVLEEFSEGVLEPAYGSLSLKQGEEILRYSDASTAIVDLPGSQSNSVAISSLPLVDPDETGERAEVDLSLTETPEGEIESANPLVPVSFATEASAPTTVAGVGLRLAGASTSEAKIEGDTAVFANALKPGEGGVDVDYLLKPTPGGFRNFLQLRSADSPESFAYTLELPQGAHAREVAGPESVEQSLAAEVVDANGKRIVGISRALAWDADGIPIEVDLRVEASRITLEVAHRGEDLAYPLTVDPTVEVPQGEFSQTGSSGWQGQAGPSGAYTHTSTYGPYLVARGYGVFTVFGQPGWGYHRHGDWAGWKFNAPGGQSRIWRANLYHVHGLAQWSAWLAGIDALYQGWNAYQDSAASFTDYSFHFQCATSDCQGTVDNNVWNNVTALYTTPYGAPDDPYYRPPYYGTGNDTSFQTHFAGAHIWISDEEKPHAQVVASGAPAGWTRQANISTTTRGWDNGVGLQSMSLQIPGIGTRTQSIACTNVTTNPCPTDNATRDFSGDPFSYSTDSMPEGVNTVTAKSADLAGNETVEPAPSYQVKVDRSEPQQSISGNGWDPPGGTLSAGEKTVDATATDVGPGTGDLARRSGVEEIQLRVWNPDEEERPSSPDARISQMGPGCGTTVDSCELSGALTYDPDDYVYDSASTTLKVEVTAIDEVGNATPEGRHVRTLTYTKDVDTPTVTVQTTAIPLVGALLQITARDTAGTDGGSVSSGVAHMELRVDGRLLQQWNQACPNGGCQMSQSYLLNTEQSPPAHEVTVFADDVSGNRGFATQGSQRGRSYQRFGYNDDFWAGFAWEQAPAANPGSPTPGTAEQKVRRGLDAALAGGAEAIRFQINGCEVAKTGSFDWSLYRPVFAQITEINQARQAAGLPMLEVIAHLTDAPLWASDDANQGVCEDGIAAPPAMNREGEDFFRDFVFLFLYEFARSPLHNIVAVQAWNEPNSPGYWGSGIDPAIFKRQRRDDPDHFARLVEIARRATDNFNQVHAKDVTMLPGALSPAGTSPYRFIRDVLHRNGSNEDPPNWDSRSIPSFLEPEDLEAWAMHLYSRNEIENRDRDEDDDEITGAKTRIEEQEQKVRKGLEARPPADELPIWITELGMAGNPKGDDVEPAPSPPQPILGPNRDWARQSGWLTWAYQRFGNQPSTYPYFIVHRLLDPLKVQETNSVTYHSEDLDELAVVERDANSFVWSPRPAFCDLAAVQGKTDASRLPPHEDDKPSGC
jgi:hypothetical protein